MSLGNVFTNPRDLKGGGNSDDAYDCPGYLPKHVGESEESFKGKEKEEEEKKKEDCCGMMNVLLQKCV
jgi:hypothetical protein